MAKDKEVKYKWAYMDGLDQFEGPFETEAGMFARLEETDDRPEECVFYRLEEGAYVPPFTPAHIAFG